MDTTEIIRRLRFRADGEMSAAETAELLNEAADKLEELDERVAIMMEGAERDTRQRTPDLSDLRREDA